MQAALRPYATTGVVLLLSGTIAVAPMVPWVSAINTTSPAVRLTDAGSLLNVPLNLLQALINIPGNEVEALQQLGNAQLFGGTWLTASATNIFGEDPGDPGRFMSLVDFAVPFKALSGQGLGELQGLGDTPDPLGVNTDAIATGNLGLSQQTALLLDAWLPVSATSDADYSAPLSPISEITGFSGIDSVIHQFAILSGQEQFPLLNNFFQVNLAQMMQPGGFNFGDSVDPSPGVGENGAVPSDSVFGFLGTHPSMGNQGFGVNDVGQTLNIAGNPVNLMPWSNLDFQLNLSAPFQNFFTSLQAPFDPTAFNIPSLSDFFTALQTFMAGNVVAFDPLVPGSPFCNPSCGVGDLLAQNNLVKGIGDLFPGNTSINHYLDLVNSGMANTATPEQIAFANEFLVGGTYDIGNPPTDMVPLDGTYAPYTPDPFPVSPLITQLTQFAHDSGIQAFAAQLAALSGYVSPFADVTKYLTPDGTIVNAPGTPIPGADAITPGDSGTASSAAMSTWLTDLMNPTATSTWFTDLMTPADSSTWFTDLFNPADWASLI